MANMATDWKKVAKNLRRMTQANNHFEALIHLAKVLGNQEVEEKLSDLSAERDRKGYADQAMTDERYKLYKGLMTDLKRFPDPIFKLIHGSL